MRYLKNQKGSVLVLTLILLLLVTILSTAMLTSVVSEIKINRAMEERTIARYLAQAGIDHGLYLVENEGDDLVYPYEEEITLGNRSRVYNIEIDEDGPLIRIISTGIIEVDGVTKQSVTLEAEIQEDGQVIIQE